MLPKLRSFVGSIIRRSESAPTFITCGEDFPAIGVIAVWWIGDLEVTITIT